MPKYEIPPTSQDLTCHERFGNTINRVLPGHCGFKVWDNETHALRYCDAPAEKTIEVKNERGSREIYHLCPDHLAFVRSSLYPIEAEFLAELKACREAKGKGPRKPTLKICPHCGKPI